MNIFRSLEEQYVSIEKKRRFIQFAEEDFFQKKNEGEILWSVPWNNESIFCAHKKKTSLGESYHIRSYILDSEGKILKAFSLGRNWEGVKNIEALLAQWNYWRLYMDDGPGNLPPPTLFICEKETPMETFLICMYDFGYNIGMIFRLIFMPIILFMTFLRLLTIFTCRDPKWPEQVERVSFIDPNDPYNEPRGNTPIGWAETAIARKNNRYPSNPRKKSEDWRGEVDASVHAIRWASDQPHS